MKYTLKTKSRLSDSQIKAIKQVVKGKDLDEVQTRNGILTAEEGVLRNFKSIQQLLNVNNDSVTISNEPEEVLTACSEIINYAKNIQRLCVSLVQLRKRENDLEEHEKNHYDMVNKEHYGKY